MPSQHPRPEASPGPVLLEGNTGRPEVVAAVAQVVEALHGRGLTVRMAASTAAEARADGVERVADPENPAAGCSLVLVLGGDGTFLRASEAARRADIPVLGVNLGRVGFLAESEVASLDEVVRAVACRDYRVDERLAVDVTVLDRGRELGSGWALNEMSLEKVSRQGVLEVSLEVDDRPVSDYGCDGVLVSTPTGSTAYAFSAGGPIVWPEVEALLVVPNNAHALFARPLVVAPTSRVAVETSRSSGAAVVLLDGRRSIEVPPGARVEVTRSARGVRWVRLDDAPFTDRLVRKFRLPVTGWRGHPDRVSGEADAAVAGRDRPLT